MGYRSPSHGAGVLFGELWEGKVKAMRIMSKKKHVRGRTIVQGKERWLMLFAKGSKYIECPPGSKALPCSEKKCLCVWAGVHGTRSAGHWWWWMKGDGSCVCLCFSGNFLTEKKFCKGWMLPKYWFYNLFIYFLFLPAALFCGETMLPKISSCCLGKMSHFSQKNMGRWEW